MQLDDITGTIVGSAVRIHRRFGPGVLESVYEIVLASTLERQGLRVDRQRPISFIFDGIEFENGFRADLLVEECVIVEVKSIDRIAHVHPKQLLTYLRLMNLRVGLLLNFGAGTMKEGLKRVVNDLPPAAAPRLRVNHRP
jgi:GxxExxY protein